MRTSMKFLAATVAVGAAVLGSTAANALPIYLEYSLDGGSFVVFGSSTSGIAQANTTVGTYTISATATGSPLLAAPNFQSSSLDIKSTGAGTLSVAAVEVGLTTPGLSGFNLGWTSVSGATVNTTETFAIVNSSGTYTALASATLPPNSANTATVAYTPPANYSIVELYSATFGAAGGTVNATISESGFSVPEPVSMSLLGASLAGLGLIRLGRKS